MCIFTEDTQNRKIGVSVPHQLHTGSVVLACSNRIIFSLCVEMPETQCRAQFCTLWSSIWMECIQSAFLLESLSRYLEVNSEIDFYSYTGKTSLAYLLVFSNNLPYKHLISFLLLPLSCAAGVTGGFYKPPAHQYSHLPPFAPVSAQSAGISTRWQSTASLPITLHCRLVVQDLPTHSPISLLRAPKNWKGVWPASILLYISCHLLITHSVVPACGYRLTWQAKREA